MNRTLVNIIIDLIAALLFIGMIATGYLLRFPLPPGTNKTLILWGLSRHQWGDVHFWISLGLLVIMLVHLALHWNWIVTVIGKRCGLVKEKQPSLFRCAGWTLSSFIILCLGFAWLAEMNVKEIDRPLQKHGFRGGRIEMIQTEISSTTASNPLEEGLVWNDVYPIFEKNCIACHGPEGQWGNFRVDQRQEFFKSDAPLVVPGHSGQSPLIAIIAGQRGNMPMLERHTLAEPDVSRIKTWIDLGAK